MAITVDIQNGQQKVVRKTLQKKFSVNMNFK